MGYQPDPMLSALTAYSNAKVQQTQGTLAWITGNAKIGFSLYYEGAQLLAVRNSATSWTILRCASRIPLRLSKVLRARNIQGLLLAHAIPTMLRI